MERISSNLTLAYKFVLPIFWLVLMGSTTAAILIVKFAGVGNTSPLVIRGVMLFIFLSGALFLALTLMRLKRIEVGEEGVYVTNYFKNVRYPFSEVEGITVTSFFIFSVGTLHLKGKGSFGQHIPFIPSPSRFYSFFEENPGLKERLLKL
ncbi:MAG TPA: hypothetical protein PLC89_09220 [Haliscomenobacter sp.]|uniref:hypothetical protein n=1 Tax=Haliscomenobacter sp. TaxID=2717303 RepID=UPI001D6F66AC|nr:hypothetical protein [Haliscomenobacter sp.]MBK9487477.1 hypothetical protein [Haliscomenobacter sp.]HOY17461.1 hypothetical protein [Haliscomenobacter sp.]HPH17320.1 hypothetical protein [Haliscomenobacter sp.]